MSTKNLHTALGVSRPMFCQHCKKPLGEYHGDGKYFLHVRSRSLVVDGDSVTYRCHHCRDVTRLPLKPD